MKHIKSDGLLKKIDGFLLGLTSSKKNSSRVRYLRWAFILMLIALIGFLVYITGGTPSTLAHLMYVPIIISVFLFGVRGGIFSSLVSGIILGPMMLGPDSKGMESFSWIIRIVIFIVIVLVLGQLTEYISRINDLEKKKAYEDTFTGRPNLNKFKMDFENYRKEFGQSSCTILLFEFTNMDMVNRYVSFEIGYKALLKLLSEADVSFPKGLLYFIPPNQFIVFLQDTEYKEAYTLAKEFSGKMKQPVYVEDLPVAIITRGGLVSIPLHATETEEIFEKLVKALDQAAKSHHELMAYDEKFARESSEFYKTLISLYRAVQNDNFMLVYQPKVNLKNQEMAGVEALLRWNDSSYRNIPISDVIKIAEDAEFISQITRWVIEHAIIQLKEWQRDGVNTTIAINLSSRDLKDTAILEFTKECIEAHQIDPGLLEFELTERTIIEDEATLFGVLQEIRKAGIKVSLDDYGTGHNSLKYISELFFHFDYIKIDKQFIDEIKSNMILIEAIIKAAHSFGIEVIAEGVEHEEQHELIKAINCDYVQGYYFSKPLPPEKLIEFTPKRKACE